MSSSAINTQVAQLKIGNVQNQADNSAVYSGGIWSLKNSTALTSVTITDSGNVGIGTASPDTVGLTVQKTDTTAASGLACKTSTSSHYIFVGGSTNATTRWRDNLIVLANGAASSINFETNGTERMRIDASGNLLVGRTSTLVGEKFLFWGGQTRVGTSGSNDNSLSFAVTSSGNSDPFQVYTSANGSPNASASCVVVRNNGTTTRSINASGTINASGADYAEYMTKAGDFTIAKGNICGINAEGKLTKTFSEAVTFVVKSTNPSYVGGDSWGSNFEVDSEELEAARQLVDRIAFCGQVPVNVLGATPGQWIIPVEDNGGIKGEAVSSPSFEQYQKAVGKVIAVEEDGRARIIVKIA